MNPAPRLLALVAMLALAYPGPAQAIERGCPGVRLDADADFRARFPDLLEQLQLQLSARTDLDPCARAEVRREGDEGVTVTVTLADGRAASRSVTRRDDIIPSLQALLLVPARASVAVRELEDAGGAQTAAPAVLPAGQTPRAPRRVPLRTTPNRLDRDAPVSSSSHAARSLGVELSVLTGARMGDGQLGVGAGMLGLLEVHGWLLGFGGRADVYRPLLTGDPETALELALLAGRRFDFGAVALDLSAGPAVAMKGLAFSQTRSTQVAVMGTSSTAPPPPPPPESDPNSGPVPRLLLGARFGFSPRSVFRTFIGVDTAVGPRRVDDTVETASARLPTFSLGLSLGATVGTP